MSRRALLAEERAAIAHLTWLGRVLDHDLDRWAVVGDRSWPNGFATLLEVHTEHRPVALKLYQSERHFVREKHALLHWAPKLQGRAPTLFAYDDDAQTLVMSWIDGPAGTAQSLDHHRQAGQLTRRLHDCQPATRWTNGRDSMIEQFDNLERTGNGSVPATIWRRIRSELADLPVTEDLTVGPIHNDNQPRNWIVCDDDALSMIDFGKAKVGVHVFDFEMLRTGEWVGRPDLERAFFEGYGRSLTEREERVLQLREPLKAASMIIWGQANDAPGLVHRGRRLLGLSG
ncbi:phosphotransferase [Microlunatus elymi]|uniref:phosphotransferase n=1 Tax=Microlunatus elymi TaxID=2596828 RepID=UPI00143DBEF4|nr:aminoglycoside phosphotransferase family protein [Microlunatus elymi]